MPEFGALILPPGTLVSPVLTQTVSSCGLPVTFTFGTPVALTAGYYWLAMGSSDEATFNKNTGGSELDGFSAGSRSLPADFSTITSVYPDSNYTPQIWVDWTCP